ncbi:MAG: 5-(carboxyamino)imidazole ribonucleotide mutase [Planctomycetes bacterium]|jgi:phosphoribosylaminoimidazole carboxylase PurE protein|nr:5-(carboxyamino)imidazole ribonucleotide mutase [Planctomycetota bacterium]
MASGSSEGPRGPALVAWVMGSDSDLPHLEKGFDVCRELGVPFEARVLSAHRTPDALRDFVSQAPARGLRVFVACAGGAAHLAGSIAALTTLPVIGVPIPSSDLKGLDALLSTVQMPPGVPVAAMAIGAGGAANAALFAAEVLALSDPALAARVRERRAADARKVLEKDKAVGEKLNRP